MKKLLSLLGALCIVASTGATVVSCGNNEIEEKNKKKEINQREMELKEINQRKKMK